MIEQPLDKKTLDRWIPWFFVAFFVLIALLDGLFVTLAVRTGTGTVADDAYEQGLAYNKTIAAAERGQALGWQAAIAVEDGKRIVVGLTDRELRPIKGAFVTARAVRPVQAGYDFEIPLSEQEDGSYAADAVFPLPGQWNIRIFATWQDSHYQSSRTIVLK